MEILPAPGFEPTTLDLTLSRFGDQATITAVRLLLTDQFTLHRAGRHQDLGDPWLEATNGDTANHAQDVYNLTISQAFTAALSTLATRPH